MIMAVGSFDAAAIVRAAVEMSIGATANHDNATTAHVHGWGAVWRDLADGGLRTHRDERPAATSAPGSPVATVETDFLALHVRNATLPENRGSMYTHPLERADDEWLFMHNGYLPTVHRLLGMEKSVFDSAEYFDYLLERGGGPLEEAAALSRLRAIPPGGMSGNAIAVHPRQAHLIHWSPPDTPTPRFFAMQRHVGEGMEVVASEVVPSLAPADAWLPLPADTLLTYPFATAPVTSPAERNPTCPLPGTASSTASTRPASPRPTVPAF
ncbi:class II glutamine amidotransferase [Streptomyces anulatus]|uniref:class II glutamine amidotransferase n=1 Tax=Streptomyces anulatus TaxID=1892 RepID=UPI0036489D7B